MREALKTNISKYGPKTDAAMTVENVQGKGLQLVVIYAGRKHYLPLSSVPLNPDEHANHQNHQKIKVDHNGKVGIGIPTPTAGLHLKDVVGEGTEAAAHFQITGSATSNYSAHMWLDATAFYIGHNGISRELRMYNQSESDGPGLSGDADTSWSSFSDERIKRDITEITGALDKLKNVRCVNYRFKHDADDRQIRIGVIAQDFIGKYDEVLTTGSGWGDLKDDGITYYSVKYTELIPPLIKAVQELSEKVTALESK
jgi:hypothetical protein